MVVDIYKHVEQCPACCKNRLFERRHTSTMKLFPAPEPFSALAMDLLGPLTTSRGGHKHVLVICDRFTKLTRAIPLRDATELTVSSAFIDTWVAAYGIPDFALTDNGPQFASIYFLGILGFLGIASNYTSPYHPETMGRWNDTTAPWCGKSDAMLQSIRKIGTVIRCSLLLLTSKKWPLQSGFNHSTAYVDQWKG